MKKLLVLLAALGMSVSASANNYAPRMSDSELDRLVQDIRDNGGLASCTEGGGIQQTSKKVNMNSESQADLSKMRWSTDKSNSGNCYGKVTKQKVQENGRDVYRLFFTDYRCGSVIVGYEEDRYGNFYQSSAGKVRGYKMGSYKKSAKPKAITLNKKMLRGDKDTKMIISNGKGGSCVIVNVKF